MIWKKKKNENAEVNLNGYTYYFEPKEEINSSGTIVRFYEETFREKRQKKGQSLSDALKKQTIEEMFVMSVDDLALRLNRLQTERDKNRKTIEAYAKVEEKVITYLRQMIKKEWLLNRDVAESVIKKYEVHPEELAYQKNILSPKHLAEALFYCQHCDYVDLMDEVKRIKQENATLVEKIKELEQESKEDQERMQEMIAKFKEKYETLQAENKQLTVQKEILQEQLVNMQKEVAATKAVVTSSVETIEDTQDSNIELTEIEEPIIPDEVYLEEKVEEPIEEPIKEATVQEGVTKIFPLQSKGQQKQRAFEPKDKAKEEINFDFSFIEEVKEKSQMQDEVPYVRLLKEKGYTLEPAESKAYDWLVVENTEEKIPLMYIYYDIEKADEFDTLMKETNKIYIIFDSKKRMFKGNNKFTSWFLKQKKERAEKKEPPIDIHFSFTTIDQLKEVGLKKLDKV